jgi:hypothetical protein
MSQTRKSNFAISIILEDERLFGDFDSAISRLRATACLENEHVLVCHIDMASTPGRKTSVTAMRA